MVADNKIDKLLGTSGVFAGYSLVVAGAITAYFHLAGLILLPAGMFMAFTYDGTIIDFNTRQIKNYTSLFGLFKVGKWYSIEEFSRFRIYRSRRSYTTYSRGNVPLTVSNSDIRLVFTDNSGVLKITVNRYNSFAEARNDMSELIRELHITKLEEWVK